MNVLAFRTRGSSKKGGPYVYPEVFAKYVQCSIVEEDKYRMMGKILDMSVEMGSSKYEVENYHVGIVWFPMAVNK